MEEKPEKLHKKNIPLKKNFAVNLSVIAPENNNRNIKIFDNIRKNKCSMSAPKIDRHQKFISIKDNYKNFYLDSFNSILLGNLYGTNFLGLDVGENGFNYAKILSIQDLSNSCGNAMRVISYIIIAAIAHNLL